jgi:hypothetical protein
MHLPLRTRVTHTDPQAILTAPAFRRAFHFNEALVEAQYLNVAAAAPSRWGPTFGAVEVRYHKITLAWGLSVDCTIRNFSPASAPVWLKSALNLPVKFDLHVR